MEKRVALGFSPASPAERRRPQILGLATSRRKNTYPKPLLSVSAKCPIMHNATFQPRRALQFGERRSGGGPEPDTFSTASHSLRKQDSKKIRASYIFLWTFKNRSCTVEMHRDSVSLMR